MQRRGYNGDELNGRSFSIVSVLVFQPQPEEKLVLKNGRRTAGMRSGGWTKFD